MLLVCAAACSASTQPSPASPATPPAAPAAVQSRAPSIQTQSIAPGVWVHTSHHEIPGAGTFPSNGLVVKGTQGAVIIDTAWGLEPTAELLDWASHEAGSVSAIVVTHWHDDRTSGLPEAHQRGIKSYASSKTIEEAKRHGAPVPSHSLEELATLAALGIEGETFYPGPGHTDDNLVVWLPTSQVLFGGCLVKAASATSLGYVADASVATWPSSVRAVEERYPSARVVVPGHGDAGGRELLEHTRALAEAAGAAGTK